ncbi:MAG: methionine--tRNA ligase [Gemmatimonadetes bacterium]|nr:methionine--tRNA ligase [Gemmatimonadota bacterium]MDA1103265.1 methionine--tRNA ligase [Gemmatimonadota bacterium]
MSERPRTYLTTPIYYASGEPHLGHAYTTILTDVLARFHRQNGREVLFLTGTDEHGQKIQDEAEKRGLTPIELCDTMAERFESAWDGLGISHDRFIRTTEAEHRAVVTAFVQRLWDLDQIYEGVYSGWYCVSDERYWTEKDIGEERTCQICRKPVTHVEEKNYFFKMSAYQDALVAHIEANPDWIVPEVRRNEILGFLRQPLGDLSISRPKSRVAWGIPLPFDSEHVAYVWVDALINYLTASRAIDPTADVGHQGFEDVSDSWWPADLHVIGKDILTTHAVYWPTLLMGVGLPVPKRILSHGWWVVGETKMSKSLGNVVDPLSLREEFGTDAVRWYLMREMPTGGDASYTPERFLTRYEELSNVLGNLASRVTSMIVKYRDGVVPDAPGAGLDEEIRKTLEVVRSSMASFKVHDAFAAAMDLARTANGYVEERQPWTQARDADSPGALDETLTSLTRALVVLCALFQPVTPEKMEQLATWLGISGVPTLEEAVAVDVRGRRVEKGLPLFPRVEPSWAGNSDG